MVDTIENPDRSKRKRYYFNRRFQNRVFTKLISFITKETEKAGITKKDIADRLDKDPAQITRWLSSPSNLTLDTISDLLFALDAEPAPPEIRLFSEMPAANYAHPLISRIVHSNGIKRNDLRQIITPDLPINSSGTLGFSEYRVMASIIK